MPSFLPAQIPDDYSRDRDTAGAVRVGASLTGEIESAGDVDWIKVRLQAGKTYRIDLEGSATRAGTLSDPELLGIYDSRGRLLPGTGDDDGGVLYNGRLFFTAETYGDHYISVGGRWTRTGAWKLLVQEVGADDYPQDEAGRFDTGAPATGEIELPGDRDSFEIALEAGRTYRIEAGSPVGALRFNAWLFDPADAGGNSVTGVTRAGADRLFFRPPADGVYTFEVGGASDSVRNTGVYSLSVRDVTSLDDYTSAAAGVVAVGSPSTGELERPGDTDWFAVTLEGGVSYRVDVQGNERGKGTLADPLLLGIYMENGDGAPGGRFADSGDNNSGAGNDSQALFSVPEPARVYFAVSSGTSNGTGSYTVSVSRIQQAGADMGTAAPVQVGDNVIGALEPGADEDLFAVDLERGIEYRIEARGNTDGAFGGSLLNPKLTVYDADGDTVYTSAGEGSFKLGRNADLEFNADESGRYYIGIDGAGRTGTYTLYVNRLTDEYSTSVLTDGRVAVGGSTGAVIGHPYDRDWLAVELVAGRAYRVDLEGAPTGRGTLSDPYLRGVYFNREALPGTFDDDGGEGLNSRVDFVAAETGTYFIAAGAWSARTGSYLLSVQDVTDNHPAGPGTGAALVVGEPVAGVVDYGTDADWFAVSLVGGRHYRVHLEGTSTGRGTLEDPRLGGIFDAGGNPVEGAGSDDDGGAGYNSLLQFSAPETGVYYVAAGAHAAHTGTYLLSVVEAGDDHPASTAGGAMVEVGGSASGEIESPGDADWFVVELVAGEDYRIDLEGWRTSGGSLEDPLLLGIHDAAGDLLPGTANDDGGTGLNSRLDFEAPYTGAYYIAAGAYEDHLGTYTLQVDLL